MLLLSHIAIALSSVAFTTFLFFYPSKTKITISYGLLVATVGSGTFLVVSSGAHMLQACMTGLLYVGVTSLGIIAAYKKLAVQTYENKRDKD